MMFEVSHRTNYVYAKPVLQSQHLVHMRPRSGLRQTVHRHSLLVEPAPSANVSREDYFGNASTLMKIEDEHSELIVHARSTVEILAGDLPVPGQSSPWEQVSDKARLADGELDVDVLQFKTASRHTRIVPGVIAYAAPSFPAGRPVLEAALDLTQRIFREFVFDSAATDISTPVSHVLQERRGVCQDFAHLAISCMRCMGVPARYVSGYLLTYPPPGMEKLQGSDASHAWISVWSSEAGWVEFDPTNGIMPANEHIVVAYGRDYDDVSPISGVLLGGSRQSMQVAVDVAVQRP